MQAKELYRFYENIDTTAEGSFARVFGAFSSQHEKKVAFKFLKYEHLDKHVSHTRWQAFCIEVKAGLLPVK